MEGSLVGSEIHGFHTMRDLDMETTYVEAASRWLRPNEIQAILCNHKYFTIHVKPMHLPKSGTVVLFDRKMLRNFRKDGHNWKKKKDGKTVKEAHEHLKVGNEERIHVYYAHGQDHSTFVRRCYWLLDKSLEHIVLVHYRETQEAVQGSPATPVNSNSTSNSASDPPGPLAVLDEFDSGPNNAYYDGGQQSESGTASTHQQSLYDINTLEWDDLLVTNDLSNSDPSSEGNGFLSGGAGNLSFDSLVVPTATSGDTHGDLLNNVFVPTMEGQLNSNFQQSDSVGVGFGDSSDGLVNKRLQTQDSLGRWIDGILTETPVSTEDSAFETSNSSTSAMSHTQSNASGQIFSITDVSPERAFYGEKTKILITGFFHEKYAHLAKSNLLCICGDACISAELVQPGVYRSMVSPNSHGLVNLFLSLDGQKPISQVLSFECRSPPVASNSGMPSEDNQRWQEFRIQMRLAHLLFSSYKSLNILSGKISPISLSTAKKFANKASAESPWSSFLKSVDSGKTQFHQAKDNIFRLVLRDRLKGWIVERLVDGSKSTEFDVHGQGVIHLFAILGYTWAIRMFSLSGLSLDFRDKRGWTALHWAACCGNEKMVAALLSLGAKANLVTDPTSENPSGCNAGDIASMHGFDGLAAYLSEKALIEHFNEMSVAGNASGRIDTTTTTTNAADVSENLTEEQLYMKDSLAAYRTAADAAARIHVAFREHALKVRTKVVEVSNPEEEARTIVAAMKIQHAFRNFDTRKKMSAVVQIQYRYRTWKMRRDFLNLRHQTVKIQAIFRGFKVRRQYRKIIWSVGVVEKAILRWRLKRKGFRGLQVNPDETMEELGKGSDTEEDFYRTSQKQAEQRVERSVVRVQALFRSKKAQQEYQIIKLAHKQATLDFDDLLDPDVKMS